MFFTFLTLFSLF